MKITDFLDPKAIKTDLSATDKEAVLKELVNALAAVKEMGEQKAIVKALLDRESLGSTGIGQGIAIPHGKTDRVKELVAVLGVSQKGVNFEALDGEPVYIFFLLVAPKDTAGPHLKALARISRLLKDKFVRESLKSAKDEKTILRIIQQEDSRLTTF